MVVLLIAWAVLCIAIRHRRMSLDVVRTYRRPVVVAFGVMVVVLAYPLWMLQFGPQHYVGTAHSLANPLHNDALSFVAPGPLQKVGLGLRDLVPVVGNPSELGGYIGIPVLVLAILFIWRSRHSPRMQLTVAVLLGAALLSLGPQLWVGGHRTVGAPSLRPAGPVSAGAEPHSVADELRGGRLPCGGARLRTGRHPPALVDRPRR